LHAGIGILQRRRRINLARRGRTSRADRKKPSRPGARTATKSGRPARPRSLEEKSGN